MTLPPGWVSLTPLADAAAELHALLQRHETVARGKASTHRAVVEAELSPAAMENRRALLLRDAQGTARAWASIYDRAAGRVLTSVTVDPDLDPTTADQVAGALFDWTLRAARDLAFDRGLEITQIDSGAYEDDARQQRWLADAGFDQVRTWLQMSRPVTPADAHLADPERADSDPAGSDPAVRPPLDPAVVVRRVHREGAGLPDHLDLVTVHDVLEEAFTDHFNYHPETFNEFSARLREDPGHRWNHWWIAELVDDPATGPRPAGVLIGTVSPGDDDTPDGSYVAYLGVLRSARGRGVARSLLTAVIVDAAERGRDRVGLEVDADSPTGAVDLYTSTGFRTSYITQSWHLDVTVGAPGGEIGRSKAASENEDQPPH